MLDLPLVTCVNIHLFNRVCCAIVDLINTWAVFSDYFERKQSWVSAALEGHERLFSKFTLIEKQSWVSAALEGQE